MDGGENVSVLIVGGGPVGLALAAELGWQGVSCLLLEQGDGAVKTPKMNEVNTRSMELCRRWGIAGAVLDTPFPLDWPKDVVFVTSLGGYELGRVARPPRRLRASEHSPESMQTCSQHWFDPILQRFARSFPTVALRYRCRFESFAQTESGIVATVTDTATGARETIAADYLVGCDGAGSAVRRALGIALTGHGLLGHAVNMFFRVPRLLELCGKQPGTFFIPVDRGGVWGNLRVIDPRDGLWRLMVNETAGDVAAVSIDKDAYLRRALGRDLAVDWVDINLWRRQSVLAESYGHGRAFLAGDAVHQVSPTGALGMNSGLADAVDLGWKLAAVIEGWGGANLLASYDGERRPVGARAVDSATQFHALQSGWGDRLGALEEAGAAGETLRRRIGEILVEQIGSEFRTIGLQLGYRYEDSSICVADGTPAPADEAETYRPSSRPGARAPHAWLGDGRSVLDLFGHGFTLLCFGAADGEDFVSAARDRGVPLRIAQIAEPEIAALYERRRVLVRPDGHVAWRGEPRAEAAAVLDRARGA
ncbi:MAG TPA: FAD-dependent monooxygenase [Stellaceae bacterium]|jgi:2-polyprenyl-6-methoxyphenol hydroxylase-like FAD-dependent oxidoreductase